MHWSAEFQGIKAKRNCHRVGWNSQSDLASVQSWLRTQPVQQWKNLYEKNGYLVVEHLITPAEIEEYRIIYSKMLSGEIKTDDHRHDLGSHVAQKVAVENITQIMWPSLYVQDMEEGPLHLRSKAVADIIVGSDSAFDFDMLIYKAPHTNTETPWHQDESYWVDLPDKRAASCWVALDDVTVDNGCMWFVPESHKLPLRQHRQAKEGCHVLMCDCKDTEGLPIPLSAGSCTFHSGRTLHQSKGNITDRERRAYIVNYRPKSMIEKERQQGMDHGLKGIHDILDKD